MKATPNRILNSTVMSARPAHPRNKGGGVRGFGVKWQFLFRLGFCLVVQSRAASCRDVVCESSCTMCARSGKTPWLCCVGSGVCRSDVQQRFQPGSFRGRFRPYSSRESFKIGPPAGPGPAGGPFLRLSRLDSGRNPARKPSPARKHYCVT